MPGPPVQWEGEIYLTFNFLRESTTIQAPNPKPGANSDDS